MASPTASVSTEPCAANGDLGIAALRATELFDALDEGFCVIEVLLDGNGAPVDYRFIQINAAFEKQTGLHDAVGRRMRDLAPDHEQHWFDIYGRIALTGEPARFEHKAEALGRWYDVYAFRIDAPEDRHVAILFRDILPRKRAEAALVESNELLRTTFNSSLQIVQLFKAVRDGSGAIIDFEWVLTNKQWNERYGSNVGKRLLTENPGVVETGIWAKFLDVMASGESVTHELFYRHEQFDGWFLQAIAKVDDGILLSSLDITDRKRAEIALGDSEEKYRTIFQSIDEGFALIEVILDDAGKPVDLLHLETNPVYERHTGLDNVVGKRILDIVPDFDAKWLDFYGKIARTGEAARTEYYVAAPLDRWFTLHASRVGGAGSRKIATVFNDITERKRVEAALRESEEKYRTLFEAMPQGYIEVELMRDESGRAIDIRYLEMNPAFERIFGIPVADAVGRAALDVFPGAEQSWFDIYDRIARSGRAERFEHELGPTNGWYALDVHPHPRDGDRLLILYEDITERKRAEVVLRESEERQAFLLKLSDTLRPLQDAADIQRAATRLMGEHLAVNRAGYYEVGSDQNTFFLTAAWERGLPPLPDRMLITDFGDAIGEGYRAGRTMVMRDTEQEAASDANRAAVKAIDVRAWIGVPLVKNGRWVAAVGVHSAVPRDWTLAEIALVEDVGERIWAAVERARVEAALRDSETRYRTLFELIEEGFCIAGRVPGAVIDYRYLAANSAFERQSGLSNPVGRTMREMVPSSDEWMMELYRRVEETGRSESFVAHIDELDRWFEVEAAQADRPRQIIVLFRDITARKQAEAALRDSEERQAFLLALSDALRSSADADSATAAASRLLGERLKASRVVFAEIDDPAGLAHIREGWTANGAAQHPATLRLADFGGPLLDDLRAGRTVRYDDVGRPPYARMDLAALAAIGARAGLSVPLVVEGRFVVNLNVHQDRPRRWTDDEVALVGDVAERLWFAVQRARAEALLRESERQLALAVDIGAIGHWAYDLKTGELTTSAICRRNFGRPEDAEFSYDDLLDSIHPDDRALQETAVATAAELQTSLHIEYRLFTPAGELRWIEVRGQFVDGNEHRLIGVSQDITGRKRAEIALRESEQRQRMTVQLVPALLWSADAAGHDVALNEGWTDYTGQSDAETQGFGWLDAIHPDDLPATRAAFEHAFATGEPLEREQRIRKAGDGYRWHLVRHVPVRDENGAIVRWFGAAIDIDDMKRARQALDASERRLQMLVEGVPQLVWRAVGDGDWTWASPQWTQFTGQAESDSHGDGWLDPVHPGDRERVRGIWSDAVGRGEFAADYRICHAEEDRYRWFQTRATPVRDDAGAIVEWLGTSTDVDDIRDLQQRQELLVAELQHRVRNILTVVRSVFGRTVEAGGEPDDIADHFRGRLDALARTQVVMTRNAEGTADLENLIRDELLSVGVSDGPRVTIEGPDVVLPAKAVESIGLAVHELTTNALKYGALKVAGAKLSIHWETNIGYGGERRLTLTWREQGVPALSVQPARHGFGSELITEALPYRLAAETKLEFLGGGIRCTIDVPLPELSGPADAS